MIIMTIIALVISMIALSVSHKLYKIKISENKRILLVNIIDDILKLSNDNVYSISNNVFNNILMLCKTYNEIIKNDYDLTIEDSEYLRVYFNKVIFSNTFIKNIFNNNFLQYLNFLFYEKSVYPMRYDVEDKRIIEMLKNLNNNFINDPNLYFDNLNKQSTDVYEILTFFCKRIRFKQFVLELKNIYYFYTNYNHDNESFERFLIRLEGENYGGESIKNIKSVQSLNGIIQLLNYIQIGKPANIKCNTCNPSK